MGKYNLEVFSGGSKMRQKYDSNPIHKKMIQKFMISLLDMLGKTHKKNIMEFGCGEGQVMGILYQNGYNVSGFDIDEKSVAIARENFKIMGLKPEIRISSIYNQKEELDPGNSLIICCEVLEHLDYPEKALSVISELTDDYFLVSVPREPIWCILNFLRGKYWRSFGNTPGHINHWRKKEFISLCAKYGEIIEVKTPLPWTMVLVKITGR